jgi:hypothetical protein
VRSVKGALGGRGQSRCVAVLYPRLRAWRSGLREAAAPPPGRREHPRRTGRRGRGHGRRPADEGPDLRLEPPLPANLVARLSLAYTRLCGRYSICSGCGTDYSEQLDRCPGCRWPRSVSVDRTGRLPAMLTLTYPGTVHDARRGRGRLAGPACSLVADLPGSVALVVAARPRRPGAERRGRAGWRAALARTAGVNTSKKFSPVCEPLVGCQRCCAGPASVSCRPAGGEITTIGSKMRREQLGRDAARGF